MSTKAYLGYSQENLAKSTFLTKEAKIKSYMFFKIMQPIGVLEYLNYLSINTSSENIKLRKVLGKLSWLIQAKKLLITIYSISKYNIPRIKKLKPEININYTLL